MTVVGVILGTAFGLGVVVIASEWWASGHPSPQARVMPYVQDLRPELDSGGVIDGLFRQVIRPAIERLARALGEIVGSNSSVVRRQIRNGQDPDVAGFRARQLRWGSFAFAAAMATSLAIAAVAETSAVALLVFCAMAFAAGFVACDQMLSRDVQRRERQIRDEFAVIADLLTISVSAGESPTDAIARVVRVGSGPFTEELSAVLDDVRGGSTLAKALDELASRTGVTALARFAGAMATAMERGTPLVDVLHAQIDDVRESGRRELMESGGRREVAMMVPVVFILLPITVVFAFYPGLVALHLSSGG